MSLSSDHLDKLRALLGADGVLASEAARFTYEADALALEKHMPDVVMLPRSTYQDRDRMMVTLRVHPRLDPLRADPRFADLLARMNLAT